MTGYEGQAASDVPQVDDETKERLSLLRDSASKFVLSENHVKRSRQLRGTKPGYDPQIWRQLASMGWLGTLLPETYGGLGLGCTEMAVVAEYMGRALFPEAITPAMVLAGGALLYGDNPALKAELLPAMAAGELLPALAWREQQHDCDLLAVETVAEETSTGIKLSGRKCLIIPGANASGFIVSAQSRQGIGLYWVPAETVASALSLVELADGRLAAELTFSGLEVPRSHQVAGVEVAKSALTRAYDEALIIASAELYGVMSVAMEITLEYLRTRVQFGKPIGSFQALQHRTVDLYVQQRMCRHALDEVLAGVSVPDVALVARSALASRIKARCSDASLKITRQSIQMHGAIGFSDECDIGLFLKRAVVLSGWLGGTQVHQRRFARLSPPTVED